MDDRPDARLPPWPRIKLAPLLPRPRMGWGFEVKAMLLAVAIAISGVGLLPGYSLLRVQPIEILGNAGEDLFVVQRAKLWLPFEREIVYAVAILEVDESLSGEPRDTVVCRGVSRWHLAPLENREVRITLKAWVNDPNCTLRRGRT